MKSSAGGMQLTALDPASYRHMPWKNGGGVTIDIAAAMLPGFAPGSWEGIVWRFSRTAIVTPGAFSDLSGYDRQLVLVSGEGLVLGTPVGEIDVRQPFRPVRFAGETSIVSRIEAGPVEVVNLIGDRSRVAIDLSCPLSGATHACPAGIHIVYAATDSCELAINDKAREISAGHAMRIDAGESFAVASRLGTVIVASVIPVVRTSG
ncbi:HutD family protein [Bradyrhizobium sp. AUGA SZCCT0222]|uniref:HutD/Ves family protein n=1 Tax=Bradyrhizobium sp. AUGA SZCCT0222 TaxID=2807668 RepID=UPI001BA8F923|nr:HutD family protein [Bradyrhizobium sp. AUGA SZCCT0222]MBR1271641.1 HutD family protein [Bradyrhizobium sp. AUGA SZCCT0222]